MSFITSGVAFKTHATEQIDLKMSETVFDHEWLYDREDLQDLMSHFQEEDIAMARLAEMGGIQGLAFALRSTTTAGLGGDEVNEPEAFELRQSLFGRNELSRRPPTPLWQLALDELGDTMLQILIVAGIVSLIIGAIMHPSHGWIDGLAILVAVCIVVMVGSINNYQKEKQFRAMEEESAKKTCIVLRAGVESEIPFSEVVVGDLIVLRAGYAVPCDGVYVLGTEKMNTDESGLTGESRTIDKDRLHPLFLKGTQVMEGDGLMLALCVGDATEWGQLMSKLDEEREDTPLQQKLEKLGNQIGIGGAVVAVLLFIILMIRWAAFDGAKEPEKNVLDFFIVAITIVVVAVPEGLPLAVTISLAYSMKKMVYDNNFVRHHDACETMGNATTICSDKTGTLTQNKMSVNQVFICGQEYYRDLPTRTSLGPQVYDIVTRAVCCNSKAFYEEKKEQETKGLKRLTGGNQTECAMLQWAIDLGAQDYKGIRNQFPNIKWFPFDSSVKRSSVLVESEEKEQYAVYSKGAAEQMLGVCSSWLGEEGAINKMTQEDVDRIMNAMNEMAKTGLRCLGFSYKMLTRDEVELTADGTVKEESTEEFFVDMVWIGVCGIADPLRPEVPDAVRTCQEAGIVVRMVTGDHLETAKHIARGCNILTKKDHVCMTGGQFRNMTDEEKMELLPRLRVLARSKPSDKEALVQWYKEHNNDVVAVTGDGANDALALSKADVGLSMGIQGTDVAKEASDIVIMDDNFASIVKTVMWGRSVYDNIRKFVQFQVTINVVALTLSLIGAFFKKFQNPLTAVQLLWVNLIMDTMAALALATEPPSMNLLDRNPYIRDCHLIAKILWRFIFGHAAHQLTILLITMFAGVEILNIRDTRQVEKDDYGGRNLQHLTVIFNTFVWFQIFNEINARRVQNEWNVFSGLFDNPFFFSILGITAALQFLVVMAGGDFTQTRPIGGVEWLWCVGMGSTSLLWGQVIRFIPVDMTDGVLPVDKEFLFGEDDTTVDMTPDERNGHTTRG